MWWSLNCCCGHDKTVSHDLTRQYDVRSWSAQCHILLIYPTHVITTFQHNPQTLWGHICPILTHSTIIRKCKWLSVNGCKYNGPTFCRFTSCCVTYKPKWKESCSGGTKTITSLTPIPCNLSYKICIKTSINKKRQTKPVEIPRQPPAYYIRTQKIKSVW